ncbi:hypothetical protein LMANV2_620001 [Leptospira interrogans serovar Manilae]|uniref:Uncharacterized protein n=1 Tax=Leptospira interrogans serovar Manilae TaxID=214675 RepID=A0AAQ1P3K6_LEPIR|nr:hypothetical protein LMANV2_620001 [Leptospira interrogans serovar Manilae]
MSESLLVLTITYFNVSSVYECESDCSENSEGIAALCCDSKEQH